MKKLSLVLGFAFMASMVFAQNTSTVNQTGNDHKAKVTQTGDLNGATVDQFGGNNNYIDVISSGNSNTVDVNQNGTDLNAANAGLYGYVHQGGNANNAILNQEGTKIDGKIDQVNGNNRATVNQTGSWLQLESHGLVQIRENGAAGNTATLTQLNSYQSLNARQQGSANMLTSNQSGNTNQYSAFQTGNNNEAEITQSGNNNFDDWASTTNNKLTQLGSDNDAYVTQLGGSKFLLKQEGNFNYAGLQLTGSWADVYQFGNHNYVGGMLNCAITPTAILLAGSSLDADLLGDNNHLYVSTAGALTVVQDNRGTAMDGNTIKYTQTAAGVVDLTQDGDKNLIWLKNTSTTTPMDVDVEQIGNENTVASIVAGVATACATFAGSHLDIDQINGNGNSLNLNSAGAAVVDVLQNGNRNFASVVQMPLP